MLLLTQLLHRIKIRNIAPLPPVSSCLLVHLPTKNSEEIIPMNRRMRSFTPDEIDELKGKINAIEIELYYAGNNKKNI